MLDRTFPPHVDAASIPPYKLRHAGPVLIVGSAEQAVDDVQRASDIYPSASLIAINRSAAQWKADLIVSIDRRPAKAWRDAQEQRFGKEHFTYHGGRIGSGRHDDFPWFDYWWPGLHGNGGTSAWLAAKIARTVGFGPIVLCGAPIDNSKYFDGHPGWSRREADEIDKYRNVIASEWWMHPHVRSMSGWTMQLLGAPT